MRNEYDRRDSYRDDYRDEYREERREDHGDDRRDDYREDRHDDYRDDRRDDYREDRRDERLHREYDAYDDSQIRSEINRLRSEIGYLKRTLEDRRAENTDIKLLIQGNGQMNQEMLTSVLENIEKLTKRIDDVEKNVKSGIRDDMDELNMPIESKCVSIYEKVNSIESNMAEQGSDDELIEQITTIVNDSIATRFGSKNIGDVMQKIASMSAFVMADMIGTIMLLALMAYFIVSLV